MKYMLLFLFQGKMEVNTTPFVFVWGEMMQNCMFPVSEQMSRRITLEDVGASTRLNQQSRKGLPCESRVDQQDHVAHGLGSSSWAAKQLESLAEKIVMKNVCKQQLLHMIKAYSKANEQQQMPTM
jgi:hypothetical protein